MNRTFRRSLCALALALFAIVAPIANTSRATTRAADNSLLSALPAFDGVLIFDMKQLLDKALPNLLAAEPSLIEKMNREFQKATDESGIDPRSVEQVAIGFRIPDNAMKGQSPFVALLRGRFDSADLIQKGFKTARKHKNPPDVRESTYQGKTIYLIKDKTPAAKPSGESGASGDSPGGMGAMAGQMMQQEVAVTAFDSNTVAIGDVSSVRTTLDTSAGRVSKDLVDLATRTPNAIVGFSGIVPAGALKQLTSNGDPISLAAGGIKNFYGSIAANGGDFETRVVARTEKNDQAQTLSAGAKLLLSFAPDALKNTGTPSIGDNKFDPVVLLKYFTISDEANEVIVVYRVPQTDLAPLVHALAAPKKSDKPATDSKQ